MHKPLEAEASQEGSEEAVAVVCEAVALAAHVVVKNSGTGSQRLKCLRMASRRSFCKMWNRYSLRLLLTSGSTAEVGTSH